MKRIMSLFLALLTVFTLCVSVLAVEEPVDKPELILNLMDSGRCGNLSWKAYAGVAPGSFSGPAWLYISGTGAMPDFNNPDSVPWQGFRSKIVTISLSSGLTSIGSYAFYKCGRGWMVLEEVTIPSTVKKIGKKAFADTDLRSITIPKGVTSIGAGAFSGCSLSIKILDPDCVITESSTPGSTLGDPRSSTVTGYSGSTAEAYARKWSYTFKSLGTAPGQAKKNGMLTENGKTYYYVNGVKQKGLQTVNKAKFYFSAKDGHMLTGLVKVDKAGHLCYFSAKTGKMLTGLVTVDKTGHKCYFSEKTGYRLTGLVTVDKAGHKCYFSAKNGYRLTGLVTTEKGVQRCFSAKNGYMLKNGWYNIGGSRRALVDTNGVVKRIVNNWA